MPSTRLFVKYLIVLLLLQLVIDLIQYFEIVLRFSIFRETHLLYIPVIILLLNDFRRSNSSFKTTVEWKENVANLLTLTRKANAFRDFEKVIELAIESYDLDSPYICSLPARCSSPPFVRKSR